MEGSAAEAAGRTRESRRVRIGEETIIQGQAEPRTKDCRTKGIDSAEATEEIAHSACISSIHGAFKRSLINVISVRNSQRVQIRCSHVSAFIVGNMLLDGLSGENVSNHANAATETKATLAAR